MHNRGGCDQASYMCAPGNSSAEQKSCIFMCGLQRMQLKQQVYTKILCKNLPMLHSNIQKGLFLSSCKKWPQI